LIIKIIYIIIVLLKVVVAVSPERKPGRKRKEI